MRLHTATTTAKGAVENHARSGIQASRPDKIHVVASDTATINQDLAAFDAEIRRLRRAEIRKRVLHADIFHRDAFAREHRAIHRLLAINIAHPAIVAADTNRRIRRATVSDFQRWTL